MIQSTALKTLQEWLSWLEQQHPEHEIELGLERLMDVAKRLPLFPWQPITITVAGTNGKGSTVAFLETLLVLAGYRVGSYTSPHLIQYNERVKIAGNPVSDKMLLEAFQAVHNAAQTTKLTYFEYGTLAALYLFQQSCCDVVILEVGLGGRLDAVNIIDSDVAIITTIDLDHQQWLGPDRESIGREKAGIFRPHKPAVCGDENIPNSVLEQARHLQTPLFVLGQDFTYQQKTHSWEWCTQNTTLSDLPYPKIQLSNAATALMALKKLPQLQWDRNHLIAALQKVSIPGRLQHCSETPLIILDVAHNPQSAQALAKHLAQNSGLGKTYAVVGMLADKDIFNTLAPLLAHVDEWHVACLPGARGTEADYLLKTLKKLGVDGGITHPDVLAAFKSCQEKLDVNDRLVVFGSFHTVGPVLRFLNSDIRESSPNATQKEL